MRHSVLHVILNSHLDPAWLWSRAQGEDAAVATARTTCDLLDEYPEIRATRGEAWFFETVERYEDAEGNWADVAVRAEAGLPGVRLLVRLVWRTPRRIVKLLLDPGFPVLRRTDAIPGGALRRTLDGEEYPVSGFCRLEGPGGRSLAAVSADVFACDVQPGGALRLTLLRTPFYAHHDPGAPAADCPEPVVDLGEHWFDIALLADAGEDAVRRERYRQTRPLRFSETTLGM